MDQQKTGGLIRARGMETEEEVRASQEKLRDFLLEGCLFHDIGKFFLLGTINQYSRFLFPDEFLLVQRHSIMGSRLLKKHVSTEKFANLALFHHRWYDEKGGYPSNLSFFGDPDFGALLYRDLCRLSRRGDRQHRPRLQHRKGLCFDAGGYAQQRGADVRAGGGRAF